MLKFGRALFSVHWCRRSKKNLGKAVFSIVCFFVVVEVFSCLQDSTCTDSFGTLHTITSLHNNRSQHHRRLPPAHSRRVAILLLRLVLGFHVTMIAMGFRLPVLFALLLFLVMVEASPVQAINHHHGPSPLSKWQEKVYRQRLSVCYQDIDNGLRGEACKASTIDKENCAMKCLSQACYESIYGTDPLEEGELDVRRGREFRYCVRKAEARKTQNM